MKRTTTTKTVPSNPTPLRVKSRIRAGVFLKTHMTHVQVSSY